MITLFLLGFLLQGPTQAKPSSIRPAVLSLAVEKSGSRLFVGMSDRLAVMDTQSGKVLQAIQFKDGPVTALAFDSERNRLYTGTGVAGEAGTLLVFECPPTGLLKQTAKLAGPKDLLSNFALSTDGKLLAGVGYDRLIHLWDLKEGNQPFARSPLKDHSDWVRALAFSPDNQFLATGGGDRSVKVWDLKQGKLKESFNDATDVVHCALWTENGSFVLSGGADRTLRQRPLASTDVTPVQSLFGHTKAIVALVRGANPGTVVTLGDDRVVKVFSHSPLALVRVSEPLPGPVTCLALLGKDEAAVGNRDGTIHLVQLSSGKILRAMAADAQPAQTEIGKVIPGYVLPGQTTTLRLSGQGLDTLQPGPNQPDGIQISLAPPQGTETREIRVQTPPLAVPGSKEIRLNGGDGKSLVVPVEVTLSAPMEEAKAKQSALVSSTTVTGELGRAGEVDRFPIRIPGGEQWGVLVRPIPPAKWQTYLEVLNDRGDLVLAGADQLILPSSPHGFQGTVLIRDREFSGGKDRAYKVHLGVFPVLADLIPRAVPPSRSVKITPVGIHLPGKQIEFPATNAPSGTQVPLPLPWSMIPGAPKVLVSHADFVLAPAVVRSLPALIQSDLGSKTTGEDVWEFEARKGQKIWIETLGQRIGSPVDTALRVTDREGKDLPRKRLAPSSQTVVVFRDHDSTNPGIRIENWKDLRVNDYLYAGGDLMRVRTIPRNPDDDCQFHARAGRRMGWEGTTPVQHPIGQTLVKVAVLEPGTPIPDGPIPAVDLPYLSDDGHGSMGRDSGLVFTPPTDGIYQARVKDSRGKSQGHWPYLLSLETYQPNFSPIAPGGLVEHVEGGAGELNLEVERIQEHSGPLRVTVENLPPTWKAGPAFIAEGETGTTILMQPAAKGVELPPGWSIRVTDSSTGLSKTIPGIAGKTIGRSRVVAKPGTMELEGNPGRIIRLPMTIERTGDFKGRVPVEVRGLPPGVRVLDIGLNGILVPPEETERTLQIEIDHWYQGGDVALSLVAKEEGKGQTMSPLVYLKIR